MINESSFTGYRKRTAYNAKHTDLTIAFAFDMSTAGERLTKTLAKSKYLGFKLESLYEFECIAHQIMAKMYDGDIKKINIAGNGIYTVNKFGFKQIHLNVFMIEIFKIILTEFKIEKIYSGGQTGFDLSAGIMAEYLEIPYLMTLPKGYKQRFENGKDIFQTKENIENQIIQNIKELSDFYNDKTN